MITALKTLSFTGAITPPSRMGRGTSNRSREKRVYEMKCLNINVVFPLPLVCKNEVHNDSSAISMFYGFRS